MALRESLHLIFFLALNFSALTICLFLALRFRVKGVLFWLACLEIYFFLITVLISFPGILGLLRPIWVSILVIPPGLFLWMRGNFRAEVRNVFIRSEPGSFVSTALVSLICLGFLVFFYDALFHPFFLHDPISYELYFPARWLQAGRLTLIPTPFGDNSRAYDPANSCLFFAWLMMPMKSDLLAHSGEFFLVAFSAIALIALSEELELKKPASLLPSLFFLSIPIVIRETSSAHSDFLLCAQLLAFFAFGLGARKGKGRGLDLLAVSALGSFAGSKYLALSHLPLLLPGLFLFLRSARPGLKRIGLWLLLFFFAGGFWYARNLILTANPLFPLQVSLGSWSILPGAYPRAVMANWIFKASDWGQLLFVVTNDPRAPFQKILFFFFAAVSLFAIVVGIGRIRKRDFIPIYIALYPPLSFLIIAYLVPFTMDRFWIPSWAMAALGIALICSIYKKLWPMFLVLLLLLSGIEGVIYFRSAKAWPVFSPSAISAGIFLKMFLPALLFGLIGIRAKLWVKFALWPAAFLALCLAAASGYYARRVEVMEFNQEAKFLESIPASLKLAYTGRNTPYPFLGQRLDRQVLYVNTNAHRDWAFHDYTRWYRGKYPGRTANTPEPAFYRMEQNFSDWRQNLDAERIGLLAVCPLGVNEFVNICHNRDGFPVEDDWAKAHPESFKLIFAQQCKIYRIDRTVSPEFRPGDLATQLCPLDAFEILKSSPETMENYFPYARHQIRAQNFALPSVPR